MPNDIIQEHIKRRETATPLVIEIPRWTIRISTCRVIAELYRLEAGGLVFLDVGWAVPDNPTHPAHLISEPWWDPEEHEWVSPHEAFAELAVRPLIREVDGAAVRDVEKWLEAREELRATRELGRKVVEEQFGRTTGE